MKLGIIGAGALGTQFAHLANKCGINVAGFFDDTLTIGTNEEGTRVIGKIEDIRNKYSEGFITHLICAIGYKHFDFRENIFNYFYDELHIPFATLVDPSCIIDSTAIIGDGSVLYAGCIVDKNVIIKNNVLVNLGVCISHNSRIGDHSYISPRCALAGHVTISNCCFLGVNSTIVDNIFIRNNVYIAGGAVVIKDCDVPGLYVGVPARFIKESINFK